MTAINIERRFELATLSICVCMTALFPVVLKAREMDFSHVFENKLVSASIVFLAIGVFYRSLRPDPAISGLMFALIHQLWALVAVGAITVAAAGWKLPFIDAYLLAADHALGFDSTRFSVLLSSSPGLVATLLIVYLLTFYIIIALTFVLFVSGRGARAAAMTFMFVLTLACVGLIGVLLPAKGALVFQPLPPDVAKALPEGTGVFYWTGFEYYRSDSARVVDFLKLTSVLTFPSFHVCMLLICYWGAHPIVWLRWPVGVVSVLTFLSVFPIGGHYLADAVGAAFLMAAAFAVVRKMEGSASFPFPSRPFANLALPKGIAVSAAEKASSV